MRTSRRDHNFFSIFEDITNQDGEVGVSLPSPLVFAPLYPETYDAVFKLSHTHNKIFGNLWALQGRESAVDINVCTGIEIDGVFGHATKNGEQAIVVKGGSRAKLRGVIRSRCRIADVVVGAWSDESYAPSHADLELIHEDEKPVRVAVGRGTVNVGPHCKILFWTSLGLKAYWWGKYALVKVAPWVFAKTANT